MCAVGGWGPMFGTKFQKKTFFLGTFPKSRRIRTTKSSLYLEGDARGNKKKNKGEEEENLEPVGREPDVPDLRE